MKINPWWIAGFVMLIAIVPIFYKVVVGLIGAGILINRFLTRLMGLVDTGSRVKEMVDDLKEHEIIVEDSE